MKAIIVIIILVGIGVLLFYQYGGVKGFDPTEQGRQAKAAITTGMAWNKVVDAAGAPHKYHLLQKRTKKVNGVDVEQIVPGAGIEFRANELKAAVDDGKAPLGFTFNYTFSAQAAFQVTFDNTGAVVSVDDLQTMADLLDTRQK